MAASRESMSIEDRLNKPYWIVDPLPKQVPANGEGQFFKVEQYLLTEILPLRKKYVQVLLKLNCYYDIMVSHDGENWLSNPEPEILEERVGACVSANPSESFFYVSLMSDTVLMVMERDCISMTVYNPADDLLELIRLLANSEGLFVWKPSNG